VEQTLDSELSASVVAADWFGTEQHKSKGKKDEIDQACFGRSDLFFGCGISGRDMDVPR
jgi:hypothetical protein